MSEVKCILFDWGGTVMREFAQYDGPMYLWPKVEPVDGALDAISTVGDGRIVAMATNAVASQENEIRKALARVGLDSLFDRIYCFTKMGVMKPSQKFFANIIKDLNIPAQNIVMVGDDFERDILGANQSGIFGIWFNEQTEIRKNSKMYDTIHSMSELPDAVARHSGRLKAGAGV